MTSIYGEKEMKIVRAFVYLDEYKMYSISSQIFEGLTEYIIDYKVEEKQDREEQKGPLGSGRVLGDIITKESGTHEKKFLHDYSYSVFEEKLIADNKVLIINSKNLQETLQNIEKFNFVKVTGKSIFNDIKKLMDSIKEFNQFGKALTYVTTIKERESQKKEAETILEKANDRNVKATLKAKLKNKLDVMKIAKESGLQQDETFLQDLVFLLNYGYQDQFEIQIPMKPTHEDLLAEIIFSAILKRDLLKENEQMIIKKFSRYTEKEFTLFGMVTQCRKTAPSPDIGQDPKENTSLKSAIMNVVSSYSRIEDQFIGRMNNEIVIDPIAVYREI